MNKPRSFIQAVGAALSLLVVPMAGRAAVVTLSGDNTNSPVFNRPTESGALSFQNPHFDAFLFTVDLGGAYNFGLVANDPSFFDTYLHLYQGSFNPADPEANFLLANDDGPNGTNAGSALSGVALTAGTRYYLIADGFSEADYGAYQATIQGPGNISAALVPEPSSVIFMALATAIGGWLLLRRSRSREAILPIS